MKTLSNEDLNEVNGGGVLAFLAIAISVTLWTVSEWDCLVEGYNEARGIPKEE